MNLIVESWDPVLGCVTAEKAFFLPSSEVLERLTGIENIQDGSAYELEGADIAALEKHFEPFARGEDTKLVLRLRHWMDDLSYVVHTNKELHLMLLKTKPLSAFASAYPNENPGEDIPEDYFRPHVETGRLLKCEFVSPPKNSLSSGMRHVLYAQPDQAWRLEAYVLLLKTAAVTGWNDALERMQGSLLGYEDRHNDEFMSHRSPLSQHNKSE